MKKLGILGGTFNPPHIAHSIVADNVREQMNLDKIIFIPSGNPPLKESIPSLRRLAMAQLAFGKDKNFEVSDIEISDTKEKSYTVNTLKKLNELYRNDDVKLNLIIGVDNLIELPKWKEPQKLFDHCDIIVMNRPDFSVDDARSEFSSKVKFITVPFLEISSSMIRDYVSKGKSIRYLVNKKVEEYIIENNLYRKT